MDLPPFKEKFPYNTVLKGCPTRPFVGIAPFAVILVGLLVACVWVLAEGEKNFFLITLLILLMILNNSIISPLARLAFKESRFT